VCQDDGVVVDVDDAGPGVDALGHLVGVVRGRYAGADVEELADARLAAQLADGPAEEGPVGADRGDDLRVGRGGELSGLLVGGVVVLAAQPGVVDAGGMRHGRIDRGRSAC